MGHWVKALAGKWVVSCTMKNKGFIHSLTVLFSIKELANPVGLDGRVLKS